MGFAFTPRSKPARAGSKTGRAKQRTATPKITPPAVRAKLTIGEVGDRLEQEANYVADRVMRMSETTASASACPSCQDAGEESLQRQPIEEEEEEVIQTEVGPNGVLQCQPIEEEEEDLQAKAASGSAPSISAHTEGLIQRVRQSPAQPLPDTIRRFMEPRFGTDFSQVRIHTDASSAHVARAVNARAFTVGRDIVFGHGQYAPDSNEGKRLLAHELTHTLQQAGRSRGRNGIRVSRTSALRIARAGVCGRSTAPSHTAGLIETQFKWRGYRFWRSRFIRAAHWRRLLDDWFFERGSRVQRFSGLADRRNRDIALNPGFALLYNRWARGFRGSVSKSRVRGNTIQWRYEYNPYSAAGGRPAYTSATHFLGTYTAKLNASGSASGGRRNYNVSIYNCSGWVSGTRLPSFIGRRLGLTSFYENHPRGAGPTTPSVGGDMEQYYTFRLPGPAAPSAGAGGAGAATPAPFDLWGDLRSTGQIGPGEASAE